MLIGKCTAKVFHLESPLRCCLERLSEPLEGTPWTLRGRPVEQNLHLVFEPKKNFLFSPSYLVSKTT
jgi:hypothetical protein